MFEWKKVGRKNIFWKFYVGDLKKMFITLETHSSGTRHPPTNDSYQMVSEVFHLHF